MLLLLIVESAFMCVHACFKVFKAKLLMIRAKGLSSLSVKTYTYSKLELTVQLSPGEGGTPLYKPYRYVPPQRVWFLSCFGLKTGIDLDHYGLKSGTWFSKKPGECINVFVLSTPNEYHSS